MPDINAILRETLESTDSYATTLLVALVDRLGIDFFEWDPDAIRLEIQSALRANVPDENMDKINAALLAITTNQFYVSLESFMNITNALAGHGVDFRVYDPAEVDEMAWSVTEVGLLAPPEPPKLDEAFSKEIQYYVGERAKEEGLVQLPKPLSSFGILTDSFSNAEDTFGNEDPDMFAAFWTSQQEQVNEIEQGVQGRLRMMFEQIERLPLLHGDADTWKAFSGRGLSVLLRKTPRAARSLAG